MDNAVLPEPYAASDNRDRRIADIEANLVEAKARLASSNGRAAK
jgi:hypothetical protein